MLAWMIHGTPLVVWMIILGPLITVHCLMVCIFIFITQYLHVSHMALTTTPIMTAELTSYLFEDVNMDFFHVCHLLKPCLGLPLYHTPCVAVMKGLCLHNEFTM